MTADLKDAAPNGKAAERKTATANDDAEIKRLAKLSRVQYDREREAAAERLGCRVSTLDAAVKAERSDGGSRSQGRPLELATPEPWPEPVDGASLLNGLAKTIPQYVVLSDEQVVAIALWAVFTHALDAFDVSPRLNAKSPQKRSGKTRLAEVLERIVARPLFTSGISPAALLRIVEQRAPTVLLDEVDALMKQSPEMTEALRGIINSGFNRAGAKHVKAVPTLDGGYEAHEFSTWAPVLLSGIGQLADTVRDRSITIEMQRKLRSQKVKRLRRRDGDDLRVLGRKAAKWATDNMEELRHAQPEIPAGLNDRAADGWEPLLAIADLAGGDWPQRARTAALALSGDGTFEDENLGTMLLADIKQVLAARKVEEMSSADLVAALGEMKDRPWADWRNGNPISQHGLARLLKPYRIAPGTIRIGKDTPKGYELARFTDAFDRYLAAPQEDTQDQTATPPQGAGNLGSPGFFNPQQANQCCGSESAQNPRDSAGCGGVAVQKGDSGENTHKEAHESWPSLPTFLDRRPVRQAVVDVGDVPVGEDEWMD